jgi:RTX calcium-binding nonapeptide repeat (4 copies)
MTSEQPVTLPFTAQTTAINQPQGQSLMGTPSTDYRYGQEGTDVIDGLDGNDFIGGRGGADFDVPTGGYGNDVLSGEAGNDWLYGFDEWTLPSGLAVPGLSLQPSLGPERTLLWPHSTKPTPLGDAPSQQSRRERKAVYNPATPDSR